MEYLRHTLSSAGVSPIDRKVQTVKDFPTTKCCKDVKSFLGLVNLYRGHVARPLTSLTRKDRTTGSIVQFKWDRQCEEAFKTLKERLTTAPIL